MAAMYLSFFPKGLQAGSRAFSVMMALRRCGNSIGTQRCSAAPCLLTWILPLTGSPLRHWPWGLHWSQTWQPKLADLGGKEASVLTKQSVLSTLLCWSGPAYLLVDNIDYARWEPRCQFWIRYSLGTLWLWMVYLMVLWLLLHCEI